MSYDILELHRIADNEVKRESHSDFLARIKYAMNEFQEITRVTEKYDDGWYGLVFVRIYGRKKEGVC